MDEIMRIEICDSFHIKDRGELAFYRLLEGTPPFSLEVVSEQCGDRWRAVKVEIFGVGPPQTAGEREPAFLFRPLGDARRIQAGEIFRAVETPEVSESYGKSGFSHSELDHA